MYTYLEQPTHDLSKALAKASKYGIRYNQGDNAYDLYQGKEILFSGLTKDEVQAKYLELTQ